MMFSASRSRRLQIVPIIQSFAQLEKNYDKEGAEIIVDNTQDTIFGGFAPNSSSAETLSKALGSRTVMSGSVSRSKNDPSQSLQMIERPLLTPDELKSLPKGDFIVMKTGVHPMRVHLKLFFKWGIEFDDEHPYTVPDQGNREVKYADKKEIQDGILGKYPPEWKEETHAHELRTPLSLMQAQLELFSAEHPEVLPETAEFLRLLCEQTERMTQMTKTLLEMSKLRTVSCADRIEIGPMVEEIFTDLAPLAEKNNIALESTGDAVMTGSDTLIYRLLYNLTENAIRYNRFDGTVNITVTHKDNQLVITVADTGYGIPEQYRESIFQPFFRVDKSRSREYGGVGLGLSLVWEIVTLHNGKVRVEESSEKVTAIAVKFATDTIKF